MPCFSGRYGGMPVQEGQPFGSCSGTAEAVP